MGPQQRGYTIHSVRKTTMYSSALVCVASLFVPLVQSVLVAYLLIGIGVVMFADNFLSANMFASFCGHGSIFLEHEVGRVDRFSPVYFSQDSAAFFFLCLRDTWSITSRTDQVFFLIAIMPLARTTALFVAGGPAYRQLCQSAIPHVDSLQENAV